MLNYPDSIQFLGAVFILLGYYFMSKSLKRSSTFLTLGCAVWAYWATLITPFPVWLFSLEFILGLLSIKTLWKSL